MSSRLRNRAIALAALSGALTAIGAAPGGRFVVVGNAVHDNRTQLTWQRSVASGRVSYDDAAVYCGGLDIDGVLGWRVPSIEELQSLVDVRASPAIDATAFPSTPVDAAYWSSSPTQYQPNDRLTVSFGLGTTGFMTNGLAPLYARCVR